MTDTIDSIIEKFNSSTVTSKEDERPITFWLPEEYKAKYDLIQRKSGKRFGHVLREILKRSIDRVELEQGA